MGLSRLALYTTVISRVTTSHSSGLLRSPQEIFVAIFKPLKSLFILIFFLLWERRRARRTFLKFPYFLELFSLFPSILDFSGKLFELLSDFLQLTWSDWSWAERTHCIVCH